MAPVCGAEMQKIFLHYERKKFKQKNAENHADREKQSGMKPETKGVKAL